MSLFSGEGGLRTITADHILHGDLMQEWREGKLGNAPQVVIVHPDGRIEEVTPKLQVCVPHACCCPLKKVQVRARIADHEVVILSCRGLPSAHHPGWYKKPHGFRQPTSLCAPLVTLDLHKDWCWNELMLTNTQGFTAPLTCGHDKLCSNELPSLFCLQLIGYE